ncbi:hypothetical protein [uncultured Ferrimonas sp.]|uniref:hypothetical protein n=1 Tax=uncultured Ferrimonas sp. TaxID=432640 RepID=UPI00260EF446|nr:hypothetical protein [uncultured Ferrimonas sp.]
MSKLNKEEVIAQFTAAYLAKHGKEPTIEQKGSWFKVDDGKSVRLAGLAEMAAELAGAAPTAAAEKVAVKKEAKAKPAAKKATVKASGNGGLTPKQLWAQKIGNGGKLPRGL